MRIDPHHLTPMELTRLLNSTPLGTVISQHKVYRQRAEAGGRIDSLSKPGAIDLIRYAGWVFGLWIKKQAASPLNRVQKHRVQEAHRNRVKRESIRNIGQVGRIADIRRRQACERDLARFIMTYAPEGKNTFSEDHLRVIKRIENAIFHGGRFVEAVYRGFGKSTISELAAVWAVCFGHKSFVPLIGANQARATDNLNSIKGTFESERLLADFPEICFPIQSLEGITQRCHGQMYENKDAQVTATHLEWGSEYLVLPMTDGAYDQDGQWHQNQAAGSVILGCGITSSKVRGMKKRRGDGVQMRPDFCIIDDPQDEESAASPQQVTKRLNIIKKAIIRSGGHTEGMSIVMPCTVIQKDDLVDQLLDPVKNPAWQGERIPFVRKWAQRHEDLWLEQYARIRGRYDSNDPDDQLRARRDATEFYRKHREEMDKGCEISWEWCYSRREHELSAIQHAYNALIDDGEAVFASEFQNEPFLPPEEEGQITTAEIYARVNNLKRSDIPVSCEYLSAFIDVQGKLLYYAVCAWTVDFTGYLIDYGTFPDQKRKYFTLRQAACSLRQVFSGTGQEGAWRAGLEALTDKLLGREWRRDDGMAFRITRCLIDANDGNASGTIYDFCRQSRYPSVVMPSRGKGVTASSKPFCDYHKKTGDRVSDFNWRIPASQGKNATRYILFDTNYWKSFVRSRLRVGKGDPGALTIFGKKAEAHRMLAEHLVAEYSVRTEGRGRVVDEWRMRPGLTENHFFDCLVGCAVGASEQGVVLPGTGGKPNKQKPRIKLSALRRKK